MVSNILEVMQECWIWSIDPNCFNFCVESEQALCQIFKALTYRERKLSGLLNHSEKKTMKISI